MRIKLFLTALLTLPRNVQRGVTAIEYAIIGVIISGIVLVVFTESNLQSSLSGALSTIASTVNQASGS
jgi:pilus assembly protein Flp/PilA